jgi:hypothetical protein
MQMSEGYEEEIIEDVNWRADTYGQDGEELTVRLLLRVVADVGIVGLPNAVRAPRLHSQLLLSHCIDLINVCLCVCVCVCLCVSVYRAASARLDLVRQMRPYDSDNTGGWCLAHFFALGFGFIFFCCTSLPWAQ